MSAQRDLFDTQMQLEDQLIEQGSPMVAPKGRTTLASTDSAARDAMARSKWGVGIHGLINYRHEIATNCTTVFGPYGHELRMRGAPLQYSRSALVREEHRCLAVF